METLSHKFIEALAVPRDRLYAQAMANSPNASAAEAALERTAGAVFHEFAKDAFFDIPAAMEKALGNAPRLAAGTDQTPSASVMPADVWARLAAAVQLEASRSNHAQALPPDSDLLKPDPILAPKKGRPRPEPPEFDVSSPGRLFLFVGAAAFAGLALTVYIVTRPAKLPPATTSRAATASAAATTAIPSSSAAAVPSTTVAPVPAPAKIEAP